MSVTADELLDRFRTGIAPCPPGPVAVALSGGGDSMALLHLAHRAGLELRAVTVDHGLRDVRAELDLCARACQGLGVPHDVLRWEWDGSGNLQASARSARRSLIGDWARGRGIATVLLGHTRDDQAETVLMRIARGSGIDGLAGMTGADAGQPMWCRPLLDARRADLRNFLRVEGVDWAEDPSNQDDRFDRVRARRLLAELGDLGLEPDRLVQLADHARAARRTLDRVAAEAADLVDDGSGDVLFPPDLLDLNDDTPRRLLAAAVQWIGDAGYRPRWAALMQAVGAARMGPVTLGGCLLSPDGGGLRITREAAAAPAAPLGSLWDGRWRIGWEGPATGLTVAPLGAALAQCPDWRNSPLPRSSLLGSPGLWRNGALIAAPLAGFGPASAQIDADFATFVLSR